MEHDNYTPGLLGHLTSDPVQGINAGSNQTKRNDIIRLTGLELQLSRWTAGVLPL